MSRVLTLNFPLPLNLANTNVHWAEKKRRHDAWKLRALAMDRGLMGRHEPMQYAKATAVYYLGSGVGRPMDDDNATARLKWIGDFLVERGLIVDDRPPHLVLTGIPERRKGLPKRVELTLEELT